MQNTIDAPSFEGIVSISAKSAFLSAYTGNVIVAKVGWSMVAGRSCVDGELQYLFGARYYDPELGQWIGQDPKGQLVNPYGYAGNPLIYVDPTGEWFLSALKIVTGFTAITSIASGIMAAINADTWYGSIGAFFTGFVSSLGGDFLAVGSGVVNTTQSALHGTFIRGLGHGDWSYRGLKNAIKSSIDSDLATINNALNAKDITALATIGDAGLNSTITTINSTVYQYGKNQEYYGRIRNDDGYEGVVWGRPGSESPLFRNKKASGYAQGNNVVLLSGFYESERGGQQNDDYTNAFRQTKDRILRHEMKHIQQMASHGIVGTAARSKNVNVFDIDKDKRDSAKRNSAYSYERKKTIDLNEMEAEWEADQSPGNFDILEQLGF